MTDLRQAPFVLKLFNVLLLLCLVSLVVTTMVVLVFTVVKPLSGSTMYVRGWTGENVIEHVAPSGETLRQDTSLPFTSDDGVPDVRFLSTNVLVAVNDVGPKAVLAVAALVNLVVAWFALINVGQFVRSSTQGEVFTVANSRRLQRLGWAAFVYPVAGWWIGKSVFDSVTTDEQLGVTGFWTDIGSRGGPFVWLGVGLLLLTIAQGFKWGVELQELEAATV